MNYAWKKEPGKKYDERLRTTAKQKAIMYYLVAIYIGYMGVQLIMAKLGGDNTMTLPMVSIFSSIMIAGAVGVIAYATTTLLKQLRASEMEDKEEKESV